MLDSNEYYYRYDVITDHSYDTILESYYGCSISLKLNKYKIYSKTPKGVWLQSLNTHIHAGCLFPKKWKWVSKTAKKRFAYETKELALQAYIKRKESFVHHTRVNYERAKKHLALAKKPVLPQINQWIYIYKIKNNLIIFDRTVENCGLGSVRAKQRIEQLELENTQSFYTIGRTISNALN